MRLVALTTVRLACVALLAGADTAPSGEVCERGSWDAVRAALSAHPDARPISPSAPELDGFVVDDAVPDADIDALLALLLWTLYALLLLGRRGQSLDCGCDLVARERPVGWVQIARPALLASLAALAALLPPTPFTLDAPFAAAGFLALWFGAAEILAIPRPVWRKN